MVYEHGEIVREVIWSDLDCECLLILMPSYNNQYRYENYEKNTKISKFYTKAKKLYRYALKQYLFEDLTYIETL